MSASGERLAVARPFRERLVAGKLEIAARLTSAATVGHNARAQRDMLTHRMPPSAGVPLALETVY